MSNFLVNLAQRGSDLGPWTAINRPAQPGHAADPSVHVSEDTGLTGRPDDHTPLPTDTPGIAPAQHLITSEAEDLSERQNIAGETGMAVSIGDETGPVTPSPERKSSAHAVKNVLSGPQPAADRHSLQTSDIEHRVHSFEKAEDPAEKTDTFQHAPERLERSNKHFGDEDNCVSFSPQLPVQESKKQSVRLAQSRPASPVDMHSDVKKFARDNIRPSATRQGEISDQHVERIHPVTAALTASPLKTVVGESGFKKPVVESPVQVRIGRVEVRAVQVPKKASPQPAAASRPGGFDEFYSVRKYMYSEP